MINRVAQITIEQLDNGFTVSTVGKRMVALQESDVPGLVQQLTDFLLKQQPPQRTVAGTTFPAAQAQPGKK
jgi:hypothetical protein